MVTQTAQRGTAGAFMVIAILLGTMAYNNMDFNYLPLGEIEDDAIYVNSNIVYTGQQVVFNLKPALMSDQYGIQYLMWDFHDNSFIEVSTKEDKNVVHTFNYPGEYLVSVLALKSANESRIFTLPITVISEPHEITITSNATEVYEDEPIMFYANTSAKYSPILNYLWLWGDGETSFGKVSNHSYSEEGVYTVKVEAYTNDTIIHSSFKDITVNNKVPTAQISAKRTVQEDEVLELTAIVDESSSDLDTLHYIWQFGDGTMDMGAKVKKTFTGDGSYDVTLTLIDDNGARSDESATITVNNGEVTVYDVKLLRDTYYEGQTITAMANFTDNTSDYPYLDYDWNIEGDGYEVSIPYYDNGSFDVDVTITDDDGSTDTASSSSITVENIRPYASLVSAVALYDIEFIMWGTVDSKADIILYKNGVKDMNFSITNEDASYNGSNVLYTIEGLEQSIDEYWDILILMNDTLATFDTYVGVNFVSPQNTVSTINHCSSPSGSCIEDSYRLPVAPVDRGMPVNYNFSVFDPGSDDLTLHLDIGNNQYSGSLIATEGPSIGFVNITAHLPSWYTTDDISYWIEDSDGASSDVYNLPFVDYYSLPRPDEYISQVTWEYWGHHLANFAPISAFDLGDELETESNYAFSLLTPQDPNALNFTWSFGTGDLSTQQYPVYSYTYKGQYLLWVLIEDGDYEHVEYKFIEVISPIPQFSPITQGIPEEGSVMKFMASGLSNDILTFQWEFGDGAFAYGETVEHQYTDPGNYTAYLRIYDRYNTYDEYEILMVIFNATPEIDGMLSSYEVVEGNIHAFSPDIIASPVDLLDLDYSWMINGVEHTNPSLWYKLPASNNMGSLTVYDSEGANSTHVFTFNVTEVPIVLKMPNRAFIYGNPGLVHINGTISSSMFNTITASYSLAYTLYNREGGEIGTGTGSIADNRVSLVVNASSIGTDEEFEALKSLLNEPDDLTDELNPSGSYHLSIRLLNGTQVVSTAGCTLHVTIDKDGDFITDELEILFSNILDQTYSTNSTDTNNNGIADPVEYVIDNDQDGDGVPKMVEDQLGTSDENPDTDGDGLTDGFGAFGELQLETDPTRKDSDGDMLDDGTEVIGWNVELITPDGLVIKQVSSSPLNVDSDNDGVSDFYEFNLKIDPRMADTDSDGLNDKDEQDYGTSLQNADSDFDKISDYDEATRMYNSTYTLVGGEVQSKIFYLNPLTPDSDDDGLSDYDEVYKYFSVATSADTDTDGITDADEIARGTDILNADTDGDLLADGIEIAGFELPIVKMTGAVYSENGTIITQPTVTNYTIQVYTNPLQPDTDGDGLTDYDELMGDSASLSDPTSVDSDGDGIIDILDPQKLVSDYTPANITTQISVKYMVKPQNAIKVVYHVLKASMNAIWSLIKSSAKLVWNLLNSFWYWKKSCVWKFCVWLPRLHSWSTITRNIARAFRNFIVTNLENIFGLDPSEINYVLNTLSFAGMSVSLKKKAGIPTGFSIGGVAKMLSKKVLTPIVGILDPEVQFKFDVEDNAGLSKIDIYQDGAKLKEIHLSGVKKYSVSEKMKIYKNGYKLESTTITFVIHDINGNSRVVDRTTNLKEFTVGMLKQGINFIKETASAILNKLKDIWDWALDKMEDLGNKFLDGLKEIGNFVNDTFHKVKDWIKAQFDKIWEGFLRETLNLLQRTAEGYLNKADLLMDDFTSKYVDTRENLQGEFEEVLEGPVVETINDTLGSISNLIEENIPPINEETMKGEINKFISPITDLFEGTIIETAYEFLSNKAVEIMSKIMETHLTNLINCTVFNYIDMLVFVVKDVFARFSATVPESFPLPSLEDIAEQDMVSMFVDMLVFLRNPAEAIIDLITTYDAEFLMEVIDEFMLDNTDYVLSINDIVRDMINPLLAVGIIAYDLINWVGSIFSSELIVVDVSALSLSQTGVSRVLGTDDALYTYNIVSGMIAFIGKFLGYIIGEIGKLIDIVDMGDGDRESITSIILNSLDFIVLCITGLNDMIAAIVKAFTDPPSTIEAWETFKSTVMTVIKVVKCAFVIIVSVKTFGNDAVEKVMTVFNIIFDAIYNLVDFGLAVFFYFGTLVGGGFSVYKLIKGWFDWRVQGCMMIYDFVASVSKHGTLLLKIPPIGPVPIGQILYAAYVILGISMALWNLVFAIIEGVAVFQGWE